MPSNQTKDFVTGIVYHISGMVLVFLVPPLVWFGQTFWEIRSEHVPSVFAMALAYLLSALTIDYLRRRRGDQFAIVSVIGGGIAVAFCFGVAIITLMWRPELPLSRGILAAAIGISGVLLLSHLLAFRTRTYVAAIALTSALAVFGYSVLRGGFPTNVSFGFETSPDRPFIASNEHFLNLDYQNKIVGNQSVRGGGIHAFDDGFILATGDGTFYSLQWDQAGKTLEPTRLAISSPSNRQQFIEDVGETADRRYFRIADVMVDDRPGATSIVVSHHFWNRAQQCYTLRVSSISLPQSTDGEFTENWRTLFESAPCLKIHQGFSLAIQSGGRLLKGSDDRILVSIGDHGYDGVNEIDLPQDDAASYGKIVALEPAGPARTIASGLRNPQGLAIDYDGRVWISDQGPEGGDEVNVLVDGANYGWPIATYGTQYQMTYWPLSEGSKNHGAFEEPKYVWVPSPAVSGIIHLTSSEFPSWNGDLLASSLRQQSLYRIRTNGSEVVYAEPISIGRRIRDLTQADDGRIILWTESGDLVVISRADTNRSGPALYAQCASCHEAGTNQRAAGPTLRGVVGRPIAAVPGYEYSAALAAIEGEWDFQNLAAYLRDPQEFAPGTTMIYQGQLEEYEIRLLIEHLRSRQ